MIDYMIPQMLNEYKTNFVKMLHGKTVNLYRKSGQSKTLSTDFWPTGFIFIFSIGKTCAKKLVREWTSFFAHEARYRLCGASDSCEGEQPEEDARHPISQEQEEKDFTTQKSFALSVTIL